MANTQVNSATGIPFTMLVQTPNISEKESNDTRDKNYIKDIELSKKLFATWKDSEKVTLLEGILGGTITSKDTALIDVTTEKIKKEVIEKLSPYIRANSKIVSYCPSKKQYKARIPKPLVVEGKRAPQTAVTELQMWNKLHEYLFESAKAETLETAYNMWLVERREDKDVDLKTCHRNENIWNKYYKGKHIASVPLNQLKSSDIHDFYKSYTSGRAITRAELGNIKGIMNMVLNYAVKKDIVQFNVASSVDTKDLKCKIVNNNDKVYTREERETLLNYLDSIQPNAYTLGIQLMFCFGVRIGELKALRWSDYNESEGIIYIDKQIVDSEDANGKWCQSEKDYTKGGEGGDRWIAVPERAKKALKALKELNPNSEYILLNSYGTTIKTNKFNENLKKYCLASGIRYLSSHKMRFYSVTEQIKEGISIERVQYHHGHKNLDTTLGYVRRAEKSAVKDKRLEEIYR